MYCLDKQVAERIVGRRLPSALFKWAMSGHRIAVALDLPKERIGSIYVPKPQQKFPARGTVISVGELVGQSWHPASGECTGFWPIRRLVTFPDGRQISVPAPDTMLGVRILFGAYEGEALVLDPDDEAKELEEDWTKVMGAMGMEGLDWWKTPIKVMTDGSFWTWQRDTLRWKTEMVEGMLHATEPLEQP